jgi:menaquinone-dependent protoporphyrinogen oxidase
MHFIVVYATTDGHTRKVARHVVSTLAALGHAVEMLQAEDAADTPLAAFDGVVMAGSVHLSGLQPALAGCAARHAAELNAMPTLLLPVSLSAAGTDSDDWKGLGRIVEEFREATTWKPGRIVHVAGAYRPSAYDVFRRWAMRRILTERDPSADPDADHVYTDWPKLAEAVTDWAAGIRA